MKLSAEEDSIVAGMAAIVVRNIRTSLHANVYVIRTTYDKTDTNLACL
jgi:hypothetical protein